MVLAHLLEKDIYWKIIGIIKKYCHFCSLNFITKMLELQRLRGNKEEIVERLKIRGDQFSEIIDKILILDANKRESLSKFEANKSKANALAKEIGEMFKTGRAADATALKEETSALKELNKELEHDIKVADHELSTLLYEIPNTPHMSVPLGKTPEDNEVVLQNGDIPELGDNALPHWELAKKYDLIDFELGNKITGAGFPVYKGKGARLQRALINYFLDSASKIGYKEVLPPIMVNEASGYGTGQLPDKEGQMYHVTEDNLYVIPTAEVPITNMYRDVILKESDFPIRNVGYTPCFRREAGSYGKDVRGLNRLHQFDKVEIVQVSHPSNSYETLEDMQTYVQRLLQNLGLPYRVLKLCGGDMGFTSALTYDMEVYSTAQNRWLEVSSVSNFETFQANRLKLRYKGEDGKTHLAHTLNGSALALPRIVAALLENNQDENGINIPECLHPYTGFERID
jgi:seryl-tRNA synthetase